MTNPSAFVLQLLHRTTGHTWTAEHRFCTRKWKFDFACESIMVAIEIEGGAWTGGRHTRGKGYTGDMEKYNEATVLGWRVLRYTPRQFDAGVWIDDVGMIGARK